jgi:hypothetical protein
MNQIFGERLIDKTSLKILKIVRIIVWSICAYATPSDENGQNFYI